MIEIAVHCETGCFFNGLSPHDLAIVPDEQVLDPLGKFVGVPGFHNIPVSTIVNESTPSVATEKLIQLANERGGEDNISVAVLRIGEQPVEVETDSTPIVVPGSSARKSDVRLRRVLWIYTAVLVIFQILLIILIWNLIAS